MRPEAGIARIRLSTTARLALLTALLIFLSNLVVLGLLYDQLRDDALTDLRVQVGAQTQDLEAAWKAGGEDALVLAIKDLASGDDPALVVAASDASGRTLARAGPAPFVPAPRGFSIARIGSEARETGFEVRRLGSLRLLSGRIVDERQQTQRALERGLAMAAVLAALIGAIGSFVIVTYVSRRLRGLTAVVDKVAAGNLGERAAILSGGDAFDALAERVNMMLDRIERLLGELRLMTDGFAHDLRSPLARLRTKVERALEEADSPAAGAAMEAALAEADLLMRMLATLLQISRAESPRSTADFPLIAPATILAELADLYEPVAQDKGVTMLLALDESVPAQRLDREMLSQALSNLIDNALRYGGDRITLRLDRRPVDGAPGIALSIEDNGPGIPAERHDEARRRFGRLDAARSQPGAGLGLALVEATARLHRGYLLLDDVEPGLAARLVMPIG
jgi:signal transduction histidine kinase